MQSNRKGSKKLVNSFDPAHILIYNQWWMGIIHTVILGNAAMISSVQIVGMYWVFARFYSFCFVVACQFLSWLGINYCQYELWLWICPWIERNWHATTKQKLQNPNTCMPTIWIKRSIASQSWRNINTNLRILEGALSITVWVIPTHCWF